MNPIQFDPETQWDIERYVLGDESLDREAFEAVMLENEELALAVAKSVEQVHELASACQRSPRLSRLSPQGRDAGIPARRQRELRPSTLALACIASAALLMVALIWNGGRTGRDSEPVSTGPDQMLSDVASHWMAMQADSSLFDKNATDTSTLFELPTSFESLEPSEQAQSLSADDDDWMLEAAAEFFEQADI